MAQIARETGVSADTIRERMKKFGIDYWHTVEKGKITKDEEAEIVRQYVDEKMSANQLSKIYGIGRRMIVNALRRNGVTPRNIRESQYNYLGKEMSPMLKDRDLLYKMHWEDNMTCADMAAVIGCEPGTVRNQMHRFGIPTKNVSETMKGRFVGDKHPNWKGGITDLDLLLREFFAVHQVPLIAKRDNYTCQLCGATHTILHVHHIRPFSEIVAEIVAEHPDLKPSDPNDKIELYKIITHDERFLDENNLITYCKECHFFKIHKYKKRKTISSQASDVEEGSETIS